MVSKRGLGEKVLRLAEGPEIGIKVTVEVAGLKYCETFPITADPDIIGDVVADTIREAPKTMTWK